MTGLIDFDDAHRGWLAGDVALALMEFSFDDDQNPNMTLARSLLDGYTQHRGVTTDEARLLQPLMRLLCLKFFCVLLPLSKGDEAAVLANPYLVRLLRLREPSVQSDFAAAIESTTASHSSQAIRAGQ